MKKNPQASICTEEGVSEFKAIANFQDYHGLPTFRKVMISTQNAALQLLVLTVQVATYVQYDKAGTDSHLRPEPCLLTLDKG